MTNDEIKCTIKKAADILTHVGWCQQRSTDSLGRVCMAQAVAQASNDLYGINHPREAVIHITSILGCSMPLYNDLIGRQRDEVIAKLHEIAGKL